MKKITLILVLLFTFAYGFSQTITVELLTDAYGDDENAWQLTDRDGTVIQSNATLANETLVVTDISVSASNCYKFTITDTYGDGIAGYNGSPRGSLVIKYNGVVVGGFSTADSNFGAEFSVYGIGGSCTMIDGSVSDISIDPFQQINGSTNITGVMSNVGEVEINSFDLSYNVGGATESTVLNISGLNVDLGDSYDFTHDVPYSFDTEGMSTLNVTISNVNGSGETNLDDNTLAKDITVYTEAVARKIILENFTTGVCVNCPPVHVLLENYVDSHPNAIIIAQHAGYYTDGMTIPENTELLAMFNAGGGTYAPALAVDRHRYLIGLGGTDPEPGPVFFPSNGANVTYNRLDEKLATPSFVSVLINGTVSGNDLALEITGQFVADIPGDDLRLVVYLLEDGIIAPQSGGTSTYEHNNVMRDAVSATWGDALGTAGVSGNTYSQSFSYTLDSSWDASKMSVVAFVAHYDEDINQREVLNAEKTELAHLNPLAISNDLLSEISIYPNTASEYITIENAEGFDVEIFNVLGKKVFSKKELLNSEKVMLSNLSDGTYFVNITSQKARLTKKIVILK